MFKAMFKNTFKKSLITLTAALFSFSALAADPQTDNELPKIEEGVQYVVLPKFPSPDKEVIEFFSFNCPSCYRLDTEFKGPQTIKQNLPEGVVFKKYMLSNYGPLAAELAQAWAIANVLGIADDVGQDLYDAVQRDKTIKNEKDIKGIFANLGVDEAKYESMKNNFLVKAFMVQQEEARKELQPASIPSFYVNAKYLINPRGLDQSSNDAVIADYSRVTNYLIDLK